MAVTFSVAVRLATSARRTDASCARVSRSLTVMAERRNDATDGTLLVRVDYLIAVGRRVA